MQNSKTSANESSHKMPVKAAVHNHGFVKGSSTDITPLEHLFVTKFSKLTIDDEYKYNLTYLVTQNNGTGPVTKSPQVEKRRSITLNAKPLNRIHVDSFQRKSEPVILTDHSSFYKSPKDKRQKALRSKLIARRNSPAYASSPDSYENNSSDFDDRGEHDYNSLKKCVSNAYNDNRTSNTYFSSPMKTPVSIHNTEDTHSTRLNCHAVKCPAISKTDTPLYEARNISKLQKPKSVTQNNTLHHRVPETIEKPYRQIPEGRSDTMKLKVNAPDPLMKDDFCPHDVASRVKAFKALMKSKELENHDRVDEIKSIKQLSDERKTSDVSYQQNHTGLHRSKTFSGEQMSRRYQKHYLQYLDVCFDCGKRIYPVDRISTGERVYHKACFRCATCQRTLLVGNFASLDGVIFCKPHYIEQFHMSGRYEYRQSLNQSAPLSVFRMKGEY
ncbi:LIM domain-containing protein isoform 3 [Schistosoma japonicum]|uniref:LIM domain-containing protein isoform 3 n=1 Tax=Schistosoma japonicum TaxID=6182 RepID=A0A4Z2CZA0_SCHJA|nr:LIM domain-containing protein isoform 3 [Schistosoma japonicum]